MKKNTAGSLLHCHELLELFGVDLLFAIYGAEVAMSYGEVAMTYGVGAVRLIAAVLWRLPRNILYDPPRLPCNPSRFVTPVRR